ncbi:MAG: sulfide/dihydroorotate dehydrogenase-like FAD/NAD-binding protein [Clostridiales bacterium]|jgi:ferredoxin--NADP+ reductase|nr:sulfide/dihydroorotate dehydrogenase-like FAD/NAD-binding protein [Clostridiales bacterium]
MYQILRKRALNPSVKLYEVHAPRVAKKAKPGQFIVLRVGDGGERVPFTIADSDAERGSVTIIVQEVGKTTVQLGALGEGDCVSDFTGPLGLPTHFGGAKRAAVVGGGLGSAIAYPQAKSLLAGGAEVDAIVGFRTRELVILEDELKKASTRLFVTTDDGSYGQKGFVTGALKSLIEGGAGYDLVVAIGPPIMMKMVCELTRPHGIRTIVSLNPIMIDGTGMCGCCRVTVGGRTRFACIEGPDFDGHEVDFDELMRRIAMYRADEAASLGRWRERERDHACRLEGGAVG